MHDETPTGRKLPGPHLMRRLYILILTVYSASVMICPNNLRTLFADHATPRYILFEASATTSRGATFTVSDARLDYLPESGDSLLRSSLAVRGT